MIPVKWIKLWTDILDDRKMAILPDRLWRRTVELFLVAGENGRTGLLPDIETIAWRLRLPKEELEADMAEIAKTGIVVLAKDGYALPNFRDRQAPMTHAERQRRYRDRAKVRGEVTETVTSDVTKTVTHKRRGEEKREEKKRKIKILIPQSIRIFRETVHRFPNKCLYKDIDTVVGSDPKELERWRAHLLGWVKRGYNPTNLEGILDAFKGVPQQKPKSEFDLELEALKRG